MMLKKTIVFAVAAVLLAACESGPSSQGGVAGAGSGAGMKGWEAVVQRCSDRVFFEFDSSELQPQARRTVECWAQFFKENANVPVMIEGNADERGTREYNLALGDRRANSVKNYLVALGVQANRVRTISYGKERPVDPGHDEAAWAKNRNGHAVPQGPTG